MNLPVYISIGAGLLVILLWRLFVHLKLSRRIDLKERLGNDEGLNGSGEYASEDPAVNLSQSIAEAGPGSVLFCILIFVLVAAAVFVLLINR